MAKNIVSRYGMVIFLVVAGFAANGMMVNAGSLEPSAGPGPTMKTLGEVEPRIAISQADIPLTITTAGSYYFTEGVTATGTAITIDADDVTLDLSGYTLAGLDIDGSDFASGIYVKAENMEIRNGTVRDFSIGIFGSSTANQDHRVIDVRSLSNAIHGIYLSGNNHLVKGCTVSDNGTSSAYAVYGIYVRDNSTVTGNRSYNNGTGATSTNSVYGIHARNGCMVTDNTCSYNGEGAAGPVYGISTEYGSVVKDNISYRNGSFASNEVYGIHAGDGCMVTNNVCNLNGTQATSSVFGIYVEYDCTVAGNICSSNGTSSTGLTRGIFTSAGCTITNNTSNRNGASTSGSANAFGIHAGSGSAVIGNTSYANRSYGINIGAKCFVDQNVANNNDSLNLTPPASHSTYGLNHAPE